MRKGLVQPEAIFWGTVKHLSPLNAAIVLSAIAFIVYGSLCLLTSHMKLEFERYGLSRFRSLVGALELLGGLGLLVGFAVPVVHTLASGGLSLLMALGLGVRLKLHDRAVSLLPALVLLLLNLWIFFQKS